MNPGKTIFALSSGSGRAGIAVFRLSGPASAAALAALVGALPEPRRFSQRRLVASDGGLLDQAVVVWLPGPGTATGEDMAEFHIHGGPALIARLLRELSAMAGLRLAEPGEFTRRAFDNERLDLLEVEGLSDLLAAESEAQRHLAMRQFSGEVSGQIERWRGGLFESVSLVEAAIDFAEEDDVAGRAFGQARAAARTLLDELTDALAGSERAEAVRRGLRVVIAGAPNVGKSSLLNALVERDAAIVSPVPGTTRDIIEASLMIAGIPVSLADTAGLRDAAADAIEAEGMVRTARAISDADILVWVEAVDQPEEHPAAWTPDLVVLNKADLMPRDSIRISNDQEGTALLRVSAKSGSGLDALRAWLGKEVSRRLDGVEHAVVVRERHRIAVSESIRFLNDALQRREDALEIMAEDMRNAARALASLTGRMDVEEVLGRIFADFCIGK
ncbi:MAG: tRNA uridine-5-carboxymethylaminomethyl(34) synthesis GTPase MnmE [Proteobacteria bacterium]|nr:tRNA uridine-5-carboxymethylaminomethyl(34) synthesis GTPase MnmE [Pseudomonadota bacterium]